MDIQASKRRRTARIICDSQACVAAAIASLALAAPAWAAKVLTIRAGADAETMANAAAALSDAGFVNIDAAAIESSFPPVSEPSISRQRIELAEKAAAEGHEAYISLELDEAAEKLGRARDLMQAGFSQLESFAPLAEAPLRLGTVYAGLGDLGLANAEYGAALAIDPDLELDPVLYSPDVVAAFKKQREKLLATPPGSISAVTTPAGADVRVDGRSVGVSPRTVGELVPGFHYLRVTRPGYLPYAIRLEVPSSDVKAVEVFLDPYEPELLRVSLAELSNATIASGSSAAYLALANFAGVTYVVRLLPDGAELFQADTQTVQPPLRAEADGLAEALVARLRGEPDREPGGAWYSRWWLWTAAGAVVAGGVVGGYFLFRPEAAPSGFTGTIYP